MNKYKVDYFSKYYFYEEDDFLKEKDGEFLLNNIKESNRFDYEGFTYKYTKFGNISKGETIENAELGIDKEIIDVFLNDEKIHLDLNYKFETKTLEDHVRIATRISEQGRDASCLIYIDKEDSEGFLEDLKIIKDNILNNMNGGKNR